MKAGYMIESVESVSSSTVFKHFLGSFISNLSFQHSRIMNILAEYPRLSVTFRFLPVSPI